MKKKVKKVEEIKPKVKSVEEIKEDEDLEEKVEDEIVVHELPEEERFREVAVEKPVERGVKGGEVGGGEVRQTVKETSERQGGSQLYEVGKSLGGEAKQVYTSSSGELPKEDPRRFSGMFSSERRTSQPGSSVGVFEAGTAQGRKTERRETEYYDVKKFEGEKRKRRYPWEV